MGLHDRPDQNPSRNRARHVALKIIKPGMDTKQVMVRFEAERQALAMRDHPNIAKVLDSGTTEQGQPYFVMELVKGVPIKQYCDDHQLSTRDRWALFTDVCQAVQHALQKGIIWFWEKLKTAARQPAPQPLVPILQRLASPRPARASRRQSSGPNSRADGGSPGCASQTAEHPVSPENLPERG